MVSPSRKRHHKLAKHKTRNVDKLMEYLCIEDESWSHLFAWDLYEIAVKYYTGEYTDENFDKWMKINHPKFRYKVSNSIY